jgi:hypothetical protein
MRTLTKVGNGICELVSRQERALSSDGMFSEAPVNVVKLIEKGFEDLNLGKGLLVLALTDNFSTIATQETWAFQDSTKCGPRNR